MTRSSPPRPHRPARAQVLGWCQVQRRDDSKQPADRGADHDLPHPAQLAVGVVGAGRAGTAMAVALARAGHRVVAASAVSETSLSRIARSLPQARVARPEEVVAAADLVLLTVPDDVLPGLVRGLAETGVPMGGRLIAHASGRHGLAVLDPGVRSGAPSLALMPVRTITRRADSDGYTARTSF